MDFEMYLKSKKIDPSAFLKAEPVQYNQLNAFFDLMHPESFTAQKLFLINPLRRKFKWTEKKETVKPNPILKPKITKPKI